MAHAHTWPLGVLLQENRLTGIPQLPQLHDRLSEHSFGTHCGHGPTVASKGTFLPKDSISTDSIFLSGLAETSNEETTLCTETPQTHLCLLFPGSPPPTSLPQRLPVSYVGWWDEEVVGAVAWKPALTGEPGACCLLATSELLYFPMGQVRGVGEGEKEPFLETQSGGTRL